MISAQLTEHELAGYDTSKVNTRHNKSFKLQRDMLF
jgi:hypothetical protein